MQAPVTNKNKKAASWKMLVCSSIRQRVSLKQDFTKYWMYLRVFQNCQSITDNNELQTHPVKLNSCTQWPSLQCELLRNGPTCAPAQKQKHVLTLTKMILGEKNKQLSLSAVTVLTVFTGWGQWATF